MINVKTQEDINNVMSYLKTKMSKEMFKIVFKDTMNINKGRSESEIYDSIMFSLFNMIICSITPEMKEKIVIEYKKYYQK